MTARTNDILAFQRSFPTSLLHPVKDNYYTITLWLSLLLPPHPLLPHPSPTIIFPTFSPTRPPPLPAQPTLQISRASVAPTLQPATGPESPLPKNGPCSPVSMKATPSAQSSGCVWATYLGRYKGYVLLIPRRAKGERVSGSC